MSAGPIGPIRTGRGIAAAPGLAVLLLGACSPEAAPPAPSLPDFELRPVVADALRALEALETDRAPVEPADPEHVRGLVTMIAGAAAGLRSAALEEALALGDSAAAELAAVALDPGAGPGERETAVEVLGALDSPAASRELVTLAVEGEPAWVRAHAAWRLGETDQDWVVPDLVQRLKYETDHDAVIWIARTLARFGNFSGIGALEVVRTGSSDPELRGSAAERMDEIAREAGFGDAASLRNAWTAGEDRAVFHPTRSRRYDLEVWRRIGRFAEYQLRNVDDGRYVLERLGARAAELLGEALHDENVYVRVHAAQSLERMGPRARPAGETLIAALDDPDLGPNAAAALGRVGPPGAETALLERLARPGTPPELRLAAARALGGLGERAETAAETARALRARLAPDTPLELRQAAAESLCRLGHGEEVAAFLAELLTSERVEPASSEDALRTWLAGREDEPARRALEGWDAQALPSDEIVSTERRQASRRARRALVEGLLAGDR